MVSLASPHHAAGFFAFQSLVCLQLLAVVVHRSAAHVPPHWARNTGAPGRAHPELGDKIIRRGENEPPMTERQKRLTDKTNRLSGAELRLVN